MRSALLIALVLVGSISAVILTAWENSAVNTALSRRRVAQRGSETAELKCASNQALNSQAITPAIEPSEWRAVTHSQAGGWKEAPVKSTPIERDRKAAAS